VESYGSVEVYEVAGIDERVQLIGRQVEASQRDPEIRALALDIVSHLPKQMTGRLQDQGEDGEVNTVFWWVKNNIAYRQDPRAYDLYATAKRTLQTRAGDCFTLDTKIIVRSKATGHYEIISLADLQNTWPAYDALSYDFSAAQWVFKPITGWQDKGIQDVCISHLGNGPSFRHTPDHKVWWWDGTTQARTIREDALWSRGEQIKSAYNRVLTANQIPALNNLDINCDEAYLAGIYAAEGYAERHKVNIAQDRQDIRDKIEASLDAIGASYCDAGRERHNYYRIHASHQLHHWLKDAGVNSLRKRMPPGVLGGSLEIIKRVIEGHADGDAYIPKTGSRWAEKVSAIHATISPELAEELQLMCMITGEPWYTQFQRDHQGAGRHPIYRVHRWLPSTRAARRGIPELPGVGYQTLRSCEPNGTDRVCDISVADTHNFVLSNGMIVHNCDDHVILTSALMANLGYKVGAKLISNDGKAWHIYTVVGVRSRANPSKYVAIDTTQSEATPGWEPPMIYRRHEKMVTFTNGGAKIKEIR